MLLKKANVELTNVFPLPNSRCFDQHLELSTSLLLVVSWKQKSSLKSTSSFLRNHHCVLLWRKSLKAFTLLLLCYKSYLGLLFWSTSPVFLKLDRNTLVISWLPEVPAGGAWYKGLEATGKLKLVPGIERGRRISSVQNVSLDGSKRPQWPSPPRLPMKWRMTSFIDRKLSNSLRGRKRGECLQLWGQSSGVWLVGLFLSSRKAVASNHMLSRAVISSRGPDGFVCRLDTWVSCMCIWKWCHELPCRSWRILLHRWRERSEFHKLPSVLSEEKQRRLCGVCACDTTTSPQVGEFPAKQTRLVIAS